MRELSQPIEDANACFDTAQLRPVDTRFLLREGALLLLGRTQRAQPLNRHAADYMLRLYDDVDVIEGNNPDTKIEVSTLLQEAHDMVMNGTPGAARDPLRRMDVENGIGLAQMALYDIFHATEFTD